MKRSEVPVKQTWDLGLIYTSPEEAWQEAEKMSAIAEKAEKEYKGKLGDAASIVECLHLYEKMQELASRVSSYFELDLSTDFSDSEKVSSANKADSLLTECLTKTSFIESGIAGADPAVLEEAMKKGGSVSLPQIGRAHV